MVYIKGKANYEHSVTGMFVFAEFSAELTVTCTRKIAFVLLPADSEQIDKVLKAHEELLDFCKKLRTGVNRLQFVVHRNHAPAWD